MYYRYIWDLQSVTRALSAIESESTSRTVRSGRFYCSIVVGLHAVYSMAFRGTVSSDLYGFHATKLRCS